MKFDFILIFFALGIISLNMGCGGAGAEAMVNEDDSFFIEKFAPSKKETLMCFEVNGADYATDFEKTLNDLNELKFKYTVKSYQQIPIDEAIVIKRVRQLIDSETFRDNQIDTIDTRGITNIMQANIKGKSTGFRPRAVVEEWDFVSEQCAMEMDANLTALKQVEKGKIWMNISKSPITFWRKMDKVYFIQPGGFYMLGEVQNIRAGIEGLE